MNAESVGLIHGRSSDDRGERAVDAGNQRGAHLVGARELQAERRVYLASRFEDAVDLGAAGGAAVQDEARLARAVHVAIHIVDELGVYPEDPDGPAVIERGVVRAMKMSEQDIEAIKGSVAHRLGLSPPQSHR